MTVPGYILAGGRSSRMGEDKAGVLLGGLPLAVRVANRLRPQVTSLAVNSNAGTLPGLPSDIPVLADMLPGHLGPLAGVLASLRHAASMQATHIVTVPVDAPFFPLDVVARLHQRTSRDPRAIVVAESNGILHPVFCLWPVSLAGALESWLLTDPKRRVRDFIFARTAVTVDFPLVKTPAGAFDPFLNINTPESLSLAEGWLGNLNDHGSA